MLRLLKPTILAASVGLLSFGVARAQEAAPTAAPAARCTGVLCELYYANKPVGQPDPTALPCHDFVCGMFGGRTSDQPASQQATAAPEPVAAPVVTPRKAKRKQTHRATKAASTKVKAADVADAKSGMATAH